MTKDFRIILAILSVPIIAYALWYLGGYDPGSKMFDDLGQLKRGMARLSVYYSIGVIPIIAYKSTVIPWLKTMAIYMPVAAVLYYFISDDSAFSPGPIGGAHIIGWPYLIITTIVIGFVFIRVKIKVRATKNQVKGP